MGRHSAPDDAADDPDFGGDGAATALALREREVDDAPRGRHSRPDAPAAAAINGTATRPRPVAVGAGVGAPVESHVATPVESPVAAEPEVVPLDDLIAAGEPVSEPVADPGSPTATIPRPPPVGRPVDTTAPVRRAPVKHAAQNSAADLHLVRAHRGVLVLCVLAVVLPFVVEVVVLLARGTLDGHSVAVWIWAPIVGAGVLVGAVLDLAHRHYGQPSGG